MIKEVYRESISNSSCIRYKGDKFNKILLRVKLSKNSTIWNLEADGASFDVFSPSFEGDLVDLFVLSQLRKFRKDRDILRSIYVDEVLGNCLIQDDRTLTSQYTNNLDVCIAASSEIEIRVNFLSYMQSCEIVMLYDDSVNEPIYKLMSVIPEGGSFDCYLNANSYLLISSKLQTPYYLVEPTLVCDGNSFKLIDLTFGSMTQFNSGWSNRNNFFGWVVPKCNHLKLFDMYSLANGYQLWVEF